MDVSPGIENLVTPTGAITSDQLRTLGHEFKVMGSSCGFFLLHSLSRMCTSNVRRLAVQHDAFSSKDWGDRADGRPLQFRYFEARRTSLVDGSEFIERFLIATFQNVQPTRAC